MTSVSNSNQYRLHGLQSFVFLSLVTVSSPLPLSSSFFIFFPFSDEKTVVNFILDSLHIINHFSCCFEDSLYLWHLAVMYFFVDLWVYSTWSFLSLLGKFTNFFFFFFKFYFIFKLYIIVLVSPNIKMNPPQVYMCSPSWTLLPPPSPLPSLWVIPVHQPQASSIVHLTWTGNLFHTWYFTCFNAILPNLPTLSLSHRVHKTVLYLSVSFAVV